MVVVIPVIRYQCCFCGEAMEENVCAIVLVLNWEKPEEEQAEQQFFCHPRCFERATGETIHVRGAES